MDKNIKEGKRKMRLLFDFDGVIHSYISGWSGVDLALDPPVKGIKECIDRLKETGVYEIVIYSSRCSHEAGIKCIEQYCKYRNIYYDEISKEKKAAYLTIDDRAICFDGNGFELFDLIEKFKPWQKTPMQIESNVESIRIPYKCPICNGTGNVPGGFYNSDGYNMISTTVFENCRSCDNGIIWSCENVGKEMTWDCFFKENGFESLDSFIELCNRGEITVTKHNETKKGS